MNINRAVCSKELGQGCILQKVDNEFAFRVFHSHGIYSTGTFCILLILIDYIYV